MLEIKSCEYEKKKCRRSVHGSQTKQTISTTFRVYRIPVIPGDNYVVMQLH